jgi:hypothetical protein
LFLLLGYPLFILLQLLHWLGFLMDEIVFHGYRKLRVEAPVFITGIPRSGTTFLHRTLASEAAEFTCLHTWEALLAPSITERRLIRLLAVVDRKLGTPGGRLLRLCLRRFASGLDAIHAVALDAPEEDYLALLPVGGCFILMMAFPFARDLRVLATFGELPEKERLAYMGYYRRCLQKHLYCHPGKRLLSKNAAFSSWCSELRSTFPDARFLICIREPTMALSSQLSALAPARRLFATDPEGDVTAAAFSEIFSHNYGALDAFIASTEPSQVALVPQAILQSDSAGTIRSVLQQLDLPCTDRLEIILKALPARPSRGHTHHPDNFSLDAAQIERCMRPAYDSMLLRYGRAQTEQIL